MFVSAVVLACPAAQLHMVLDGRRRHAPIAGTRKVQVCAKLQNPGAETYDFSSKA